MDKLMCDTIRNCCNNDKYSYNNVQEVLKRGPKSFKWRKNPNDYNDEERNKYVFTFSSHPRPKKEEYWECLREIDIRDLDKYAECVLNDKEYVINCLVHAYRSKRSKVIDKKNFRELTDDEMQDISLKGYLGVLWQDEHTKFFDFDLKPKYCTDYQKNLITKYLDTIMVNKGYIVWWEESYFYGRHYAVRTVNNDVNALYCKEFSELESEFSKIIPDKVCLGKILDSSSISNEQRIYCSHKENHYPECFSIETPFVVDKKWLEISNTYRKSIITSGDIIKITNKTIDSMMSGSLVDIPRLSITSDKNDLGTDSANNTRLIINEICYRKAPNDYKEIISMFVDKPTLKKFETELWYEGKKHYNYFTQHEIESLVDSWKNKFDSLNNGVTTKEYLKPVGSYLSDNQDIMRNMFSFDTITLVQAPTGSGKTHSVIHYADKFINRPVLYIALNKTVVENKFLTEKSWHVITGANYKDFFELVWTWKQNELYQFDIQGVNKIDNLRISMTGNAFKYIMDDPEYKNTFGKNEWNIVLDEVHQFIQDQTFRQDVIDDVINKVKSIADNFTMISATPGDINNVFDVSRNIIVKNEIEEIVKYDIISCKSKGNWRKTLESKITDYLKDGWFIHCKSDLHLRKIDEILHSLPGCNHAVIKRTLINNDDSVKELANTGDMSGFNSIGTTCVWSQGNDGFVHGRKVLFIYFVSEGTDTDFVQSMNRMRDAGERRIIFIDDPAAVSIIKNYVSEAEINRWKEMKFKEDITRNKMTEMIVGKDIRDILAGEFTSLKSECYKSYQFNANLPAYCNALKKYNNILLVKENEYILEESGDSYSKGCNTPLYDFIREHFDEIIDNSTTEILKKLISQEYIIPGYELPGSYDTAIKRMKEVKHFYFSCNNKMFTVDRSKFIDMMDALFTNKNRCFNMKTVQLAEEGIKIMCMDDKLTRTAAQKLIDGMNYLRARIKIHRLCEVNDIMKKMLLFLDYDPLFNSIMSEVDTITSKYTEACKSGEEKGGKVNEKPVIVTWMQDGVEHSKTFESAKAFGADFKFKYEQTKKIMKANRFKNRSKYANSYPETEFTCFYL